MDGGIDWLHLYFRDTRYTVTSIDCRVETQLTADVVAGRGRQLPVDLQAAASRRGYMWIERTGTNEEQTTVIGVGKRALGYPRAHRRKHPEGSSSRARPGVARGAEVRERDQHGGGRGARPFRPGPDSVIEATAWASVQ